MIILVMTYMCSMLRAAMSSVEAARQVTVLAKILDQGSTIRIVEDVTTTKVINNPVVMLKLSTERRRANGKANDSFKENTRRFGTDAAR